LLYDKVWKFDIKNIYPKYIKVYTDIDPTVDFVFPVNKIDREKSEKIVSWDKFEVNQMHIQKL
jgi:hypothetical protein